MEKIEKTKRKKGFKPVGIFLFGMFFGLLFTLGAIAGVGFWAYNNLTLDKLGIEVGSESVEKKTIKELASSVTGIMKNIDTYTIGQMEEDFDIVIVGKGGFIAETMYGLDMTPLKNATKDTLKDTFQDIIGTATMQTVIENLGEATELGLFDTIMDTEVEFYFNSSDNKLYATLKDGSYSDPVDEKLYELTDDDKIKMGTISYTINSGKIVASFRNVPIKQSFNDFEKVTKTLQIYKVLGYSEKSGNYYTDEACTDKVTGLMSTIAGKTIEELDQDFIDNLTLVEVLDLTKSGDDYYQDGKKVNGIINSIAEKTVKELSTDDAFNNIYIYEVMDYDKVGDIYYTDSTHSTQVAGVMKSIAGFTIGNLSTNVGTIKIADVLELDGTETGVLKFIYSNNSTIDSLTTDIEDLKLGEALGIAESDATGIVRKFYNEKINELNSKLNPSTLTVADAMGYYLNETDSKYYTDASYSTEVTGVMATLASSTLNNITGAIDNIKIVDILDSNSPILKLFNDGEKADLTVGNLSDKLVAKIKVAKIRELNNAGLITDISLDESSPVWDKTINEIIEKADLATKTTT